MTYKRAHGPNQVTCHKNAKILRHDHLILDWCNKPWIIMCDLAKKLSLTGLAKQGKSLLLIKLMKTQ